jgi:hypothetical protein
MSTSGPPDAVAQIAPLLKSWQKPIPADLTTLRELTSKSLDAVTHLTEYEDEKANRILTAMAFISAFAGVLFAAVTSHYSNAYLQQLKIASHFRFLLVEVGYGFFAIYAMVLSVGVGFSLYGMMPRFNLPKAWKSPGSFPKSFLFFEKINEVTPADWANAFISTAADELTFHYVKNNILESYLVSGKIPQKLSPLKKASTLYIASTCILVLWVVLTAVAIASIDVFPSSAVSAIRATSAENELLRHNQITPAGLLQMQPSDPEGDSPITKASETRQVRGPRRHPTLH